MDDDYHEGEKAVLSLSIATSLWISICTPRKSNKLNPEVKTKSPSNNQAKARELSHA